MGTWPTRRLLDLLKLEILIVQAPLRVASEKGGSLDYMQIWAGQAARLGKAMPAAELTRRLAEKALCRL